MKIEDVLNAYPSRLGEAEVTDSDKLRDLREWADTAASMLCELKNEAQDVDDGMVALITERDQLRKMHDGVSADLDRERREHQEAMAEAAARELKLAEERDGLMKLRDEAARGALFFKSEAEKAIADLAGVSATLDKAGIPRSVDFMGNMITPAGRVAVLLALHERIAPPKRRSKTKTIKKPKAAAKRNRRKP